jgi:hypothetical protein
MGTGLLNFIAPLREVDRCIFIIIVENHFGGLTLGLLGRILQQYPHQPIVVRIRSAWTIKNYPTVPGLEIRQYDSEHIVRSARVCKKCRRTHP